MNRFLISILILAAACHHSGPTNEPLAFIQIQDRNGLTETISNPERLTAYEAVDFTSSQPYKKVLRVYKADGKNHSKISTYHPNGVISQYLEAEEMRAHGAYREWFPNGQLKIEAKVIGGTADISPGSQHDWLFDGLSQVWDEQGNLVAKIHYEKGALEGPSLYFFPSGQIQRELPFVKSNLEGEAIEFLSDGQIKSKTHYKRGVQEGESLGYFKDGQLAWVEEYTDGLILKAAYYNPQGELVSEIENGGGFQALYEDKALALIEFRIGKPDGIVRKFTPSGELHRSFHLKNGQKQGEEVEFYLASEMEGVKDKPLPKLSLSWNENTIHGCVKTWYNNGQLQSQRDYSHNQRSGSSLAWYRDGTLMMIEEYEEERLINGQYYRINKRDPISTVSNGNGLVTIYDEAGTFLKKIPYAKGKPVDPEN